VENVFWHVGSTETWEVKKRYDDNMWMLEI
jgi:hypothetical protein